MVTVGYKWQTLLSATPSNTLIPLFSCWGKLALPQLEFEYGILHGDPRRSQVSKRRRSRAAFTNNVVGEQERVQLYSALLCS